MHARSDRQGAVRVRYPLACRCCGWCRAVRWVDARLVGALVAWREPCRYRGRTGQGGVATRGCMTLPECGNIARRSGTILFALFVRFSRCGILRVDRHRMHRIFDRCIRQRRGTMPSCRRPARHRSVTAVRVDAGLVERARAVRQVSPPRFDVGLRSTAHRPLTRSSET